MKGVSVSTGISLGNAYIYNKSIKIHKIECLESESEINRLKEVLKISKKQIEDLIIKTIKDINEETAGIFEAQKLILEDDMFIEEIQNEIKEKKINAEYAVTLVIEKYMEIFQQMEDVYLSERAADIKDIGNRILSNLLGINNDLSSLPNNAIIVAKDLLPSDTAQLDRTKVNAFITEEGGYTSHAAIMSRVLGIPAIIGIEDIFSHIQDKDFIIVDGNDGEIIVNPNKDLVNTYTDKKKEEEAQKQLLQKLIDLPSETTDGHSLELEANIGTPEDIDNVLGVKAHGVGLFRSEFLYMERKDFPSEDEQFESYKKVVESMQGKRVTIRTLDIGGDKTLPYLKLANEMNPFLGYRGIRLCLKENEMFKTQLRAILRAAYYGSVSVLYPMISDVKEVLEANSILDEAKKELLEEGFAYGEDIKIGVMIEVPSAALTADIIIKNVDFFSIGTNDFTQYILAVDRCNREVSAYYNYFHPGLLRLMKNCIDVAHKEGKYVAMCGEMAADPNATAILIGLGLDALSMTPSALLKIKECIRNISYMEAKVLAKDALQK